MKISSDEYQVCCALPLRQTGQAFACNCSQDRGIAERVSGDKSRENASSALPDRFVCVIHIHTIIHIDGLYLLRRLSNKTYSLTAREAKSLYGDVQRAR